MPTIRSRLLFTIVFVIASLGLFYAARMMYASTLVVTPKMAMERWSCEGRVDDLQEWDIQRKSLEQAKKIVGHDADIVSDLGRMYEFRALSFPAWNEEAKKSRQHSIELFRQSTQQRPSWALAWLNLAQAKIMNQETDAEAFDAIRRGFRFGRWQEKVQHRLLWLSVGIWPVLPQDIRKTVINMTRMMLEEDKSVLMLVVLAFRFQWQDELKKIMTRKEHLELIKNFEEDKGFLDRMIKQQSKSLVC